MTKKRFIKVVMRLGVSFMLVSLIVWSTSFTGEINGSGLEVYASSGAIPNEPLRAVVSLDNQKLYLLRAQDPQGILQTIDLKSRHLLNTVKVGKTPIAMAVLADRNEAYIANHQSNTVSVIDLKAQAVVATIPVGQNPIRIAVSPSNRHVYVTEHGSRGMSISSVCSSSNRFTSN